MSEKRTITLTDRPPVRIVEDEWPVLAHGSYKWFDNQYEFQANRITNINVRVRQHADGRALVYAIYKHTSQFQNEADVHHSTGVLLDKGADLVAAIKIVCQTLNQRLDGDNSHVRDCMNECIADLPAQDI